MLRVVSYGRQAGTPWDHQGKTKISQIFITCSMYRIDSIQFAYVENGRAVFSERIGEREGWEVLKTITFDYPSEYITRVSCCYETYYHGMRYLSSITFYTTKSRYGPFKPSISGGDPDCDILDEFSEVTVKEFDYDVGGEFCGFFGSSWEDGVETIGFYMMPLQPVDQSGSDRSIIPYEV